MSRLGILSLALFLAGCFEDPKRQLAECELQAAKIFPSFLDAPEGQPLAQIQLCMKAAGYEWVPADPRCNRSLIMQGKPDVGDEGAHCFHPSN
jgi:hypothetical protein